MTPDPYAYQKITQLSACKLQLSGMKHSSGRSIIAHVKKTYGFKGTNESVVQQFEAILRTEGILKDKRG